MLYREEKPDKGSIVVGGTNVAKLRNSKVYKLRRKIGVVFLFLSPSISPFSRGSTVVFRPLARGG
jgi:ABC-type phosphate/phosphonate transport system ATPase subunit